MSRLTRTLIFVVTVCVAAALAMPENLVANRSEVDELRAQLNKLNDEFTRAGAAFDTAFWALDETEKSIADTEARISANEAELDEAQELLQSRMSAWYRSDDLGFVTFLLGAQDFSDLVNRMEFASRIALTDAAAVDRVETLLAELRKDREQLEEQRDEQSEQVQKLKAERDTLQGRLRDKRAEYDRVQAELAEAARREEEARRRAAEVANRPAPTITTSSGAVAGPNGMVFPVAGPNYYSDTWGASRAGGRRRHQGTDIMAATGTPVVATLPGTLTSRSGTTAGLYLILRADNGWTFYYMHLDSISVGSGRVEAGQVIGTVGYTGNASASAPHLHYEIHLPGRGAVNPYPYLLQMQGR